MSSWSASRGRRVVGESAVTEENLGYVRAIRDAARRRQGDAVAAVFRGRSTTWSDALDAAARTAGALRAMGVAPGDRVAVLSANSDEYMLLYLAIPWAGAVIVPMNTRWSVAENAFALDDCTPKIAFVSAETEPVTVVLIEERGTKVIWLANAPNRDGRSWSEIVSHDPIEDVGRAGTDLFGIFYTGGTTGRSKGVMLSHAGILGNCMSMRALGLCPDDCNMLIVAPLFHLAAVATLTMTMLANGAAIIMPAFDPSGTLVRSRLPHASQSVATLRQARLTTSLPTAPLNKQASARFTRRVLVPDK